MLLYKLFFFNYILQVTGNELMDSLLASEPSLYEKYAEDLVSSESEAEGITSAKNSNAHNLNQLVNSLMIIIDLLQSRRVNHMMDQAIKPFKTKPLEDRN